MVEYSLMNKCEHTHTYTHMCLRAYSKLEIRDNRKMFQYDYTEISLPSSPFLSYSISKSIGKLHITQKCLIFVTKQMFN